MLLAGIQGSFQTPSPGISLLSLHHTSSHSIIIFTSKIIIYYKYLLLSIIISIKLKLNGTVYIKPIITQLFIYWSLGIFKQVLSPALQQLLSILTALNLPQPTRDTTVFELFSQIESKVCVFSVIFHNEQSPFVQQLW